jgi:hypothetical protein
LIGLGCRDRTYDLLLPKQAFSLAELIRVCMVLHQGIEP